MISLLFAATVLSPTPDIRSVDWLVGEWEFADRAMLPGSSYEEYGTRSCVYALDNQYIRCESRGTSGDTTRTYVFYLNYNAQSERFEMLSMWGNIPGKALYTGTLSADGRQLELRDEALDTDDDGIQRRSWAVITYDDNGSMVWESGSAPDGAERGPVRYRDDATRLNDEAAVDQ